MKHFTILRREIAIRTEKICEAKCSTKDLEIIRKRRGMKSAMNWCFPHSRAYSHYSLRANPSPPLILRAPNEETRNEGGPGTPCVLHALRNPACKPQPYLFRATWFAVLIQVDVGQAFALHTLRTARSKMQVI